MSEFNAGDSSTWPAMLSVEQIAQIFQRSALTIRHHCKPSSRHPFVPAPASKRPLRWRKVDVQRVTGKVA